MKKPVLKLNGSTEWGLALWALAPALKLTLVSVAREKGADGEAWLDTMKAEMIRDHKMTTIVEGMSIQDDAAAGLKMLEAIDTMVELARYELRTEQVGGGE